MTTSHLSALQVRLFNERTRLFVARTEGEREMRRVFVAQVEKEIAGEVARLGAEGDALPDMTDDELLAALLA